MSIGQTQAPVSLLLSQEISASAKILWLATRLSNKPTTPAQLAAATGLTKPTIRKNLATLTTMTAPDAPGVTLPANLLADARLRPQAKILYGILQTLSTDLFTYAALGAQANLSAKTTKQLTAELTKTGWLTTSQRNQMAPIKFTLGSPDIDRSRAEVALAEHRLKQRNYSGETFMHQYLSLLIDSDEFEENARPGWLINPLTEETMELDRYYAPIAAFEYNGPQHYRVTELYPSREALAMQKARDLMKEGHCARRGVRFIVITRKDLTLAGMQKKIGTVLPLRDLRGHEPLIAFLEQARHSAKKV